MRQEQPITRYKINNSYSCCCFVISACVETKKCYDNVFSDPPRRRVLHDIALAGPGVRRLHRRGVLARQRHRRRHVHRGLRRDRPGHHVGMYATVGGHVALSCIVVYIRDC